VTSILDSLTRAMEDLGYCEDDIFGMNLALDEAITNAFQHGNHGDRSKKVEIRYQVTPQYVLADVEDEGDGFDPHLVEDPRGAERVGSPGGRGLFLMRSHVSWVRYNGRGNHVTLCKYRSVG
jgi:serine/threonine-protein kinase RsbW